MDSLKVMTVAVVKVNGLSVIFNIAKKLCYNTWLLVI